MDLNWLANMCTIILGVSSLALGLDPAHSENITVYHVNPGSYNAAPVNMNTASQAGDAFFDMRSVVLPYECSSNSSRKGSDCTNPEVTATDLVITKLVLTVDKTYGKYGFCNVCVNGSAGISGSCEGQDGQYVCSCSHHGGGGGGGYKCDTFFGKKVCLPDFSGKSHLNQSACAATCRKTSATETAFARDVVDIATAYPPRPPTPCNGSVGKENITVFFGKMGCREGQSDWECWRDNVAKKTGGLWYSTTKNGYCGDGTVPAPANCTWKVAQEIKRVNKVRHILLCIQFSCWCLLLLLLLRPPSSLHVPPQRPDERHGHHSSRGSRRLHHFALQPLLFVWYFMELAITDGLRFWRRSMRFVNGVSLSG